jgi:hypothetical protein
MRIVHSTYLVSVVLRPYRVQRAATYIVGLPNEVCTVHSLLGIAGTWGGVQESRSRVLRVEAVLVNALKDARYPNLGRFPEAF